MDKRQGVHVILGAITPDYNNVDAETLTYPNLRTALKSNNLPSFLKRHSLQILHKRLKVDRVDTASIQEELRAAYLLSAAYRLQKARTMPEKLFWSTQFTATSVKLFGRPFAHEVSNIATEELAYFERAINELSIDAEFAKPVLDGYRSLVSKRVKVRPSLERRYETLLKKLHDFFMSEYGECFEAFDAYEPADRLAPPELAICFDAGLEILKKRDSAWMDWKVIHNKGAKLSVNSARKRIIIGSRRASVTVSEARGLFAHEVLVHAQRSAQGSKRCFELAVGLPDYVAAEEGLGVLVESAIEGSVPLKVKDRYVDIALALGNWRRRPLLRNEMYIFCYTRAVVRSIVNVEEIDLDELERATWEHVNRIYRGSLGNKYLAVFTKDVAYYRGFIKMAGYLRKSAQRGRLTDSLAYLYQGKFDPTNPQHRKFLARIEEAS